MEEMISIRRAANILGICDQTLRSWEKQGRIAVVRTAGRQRRYKLSDIENLLQEINKNSDKIN